MDPIKRLTKKILQFRDKRNWKQFHTPKDLSISLVLEASEVMEHFRWKNDKEVKEYVKKNKEEISEELADVLYALLIMSHDLNINIEEALDRKMTINETKYPVKKFKNSNAKYNKL